MDDDSNSHPLPPDVPPPSGAVVSPPNEAVPQSTTLRQILTFLIGLPLGFLVHFVALVFLAFVFYPGTPILAGTLLCGVSLALAIPLLWRPHFRGIAFGILIGVAVTALLIAQCATSGPRA